jgi:iron complex transport system substrate-binding protein
MPAWKRTSQTDIFCILVTMRPVILFLLFALLGCSVKPENKNVSAAISRDSVSIKYASGFKISSIGNAKLVEVTYPYQGATSGYQYLLVPRGEQPPSGIEGAKVIFTPVKSIVCTSTTHIPLLDYLDETDKLTGFTTTDYISSEKMRRRIDEGKVTELGVDKGINLERLAMLKPDVVMGYTMTSDYGQFKKIEELNVPVVINAEYLERHPLGRAEWIKFVALFFNKEKHADSVFTVIEKKYLETKALVDSVKTKPTVLSGIMYGDAWFLPGGENYASKILKDGGCDYLWSNDPSHGFLQVAFEKVYDQAKNADLWIGVGNFKTLKEVEDADHRYAKFKAFQQKQVYTYNAREGAKGGSEFLELGYLRPDIILQDLVKIAHPKLLPEYKLYFHKRLN